MLYLMINLGIVLQKLKKFKEFLKNIYFNHVDFLVFMNLALIVSVSQLKYLHCILNLDSFLFLNFSKIAGTHEKFSKSSK